MHLSTRYHACCVCDGRVLCDRTVIRGHVKRAHGKDMEEYANMVRDRERLRKKEKRRKKKREEEAEEDGATRMKRNREKRIPAWTPGREDKFTSITSF